MKITQKLHVKLSEYGEPARYCVFPVDMSENTYLGYILIGDIEVDIGDVTPAEELDLTEPMLKKLRKELAEVKAENYRKEKAIEDKINDLLCLPVGKGE